MSPLVLEWPSTQEASCELPGSGGWSVADATGGLLALVDSPEEADEFVELAKRYYDEARTCGHPGAGAWVASKLPIIARALTCAEREELDTLGTPVLQQEPRD